MQGNPRSTAIRAVAKEYNIELDIVHTEPAKGLTNDYLKINKLGKVPSFVGQDGYELTEAIAIAIYSKSFSILSLGWTRRSLFDMMKNTTITVIPV